MTEHEKFILAVGKNIDKKRKEKGLTFQQLAELSNIDKSNLVKLTSEGINTTLISLYKIAKALDVAVWELLKV